MTQEPDETNETQSEPEQDSTQSPQQARLRDELESLHELLENVDEVSADTKDAMRSVVADIGRLLDPESDDDDWTHIDKRWREAVLDFESQHPKLTQAVDQITGLLANIGF